LPSHPLNPLTPYPLSHLPDPERTFKNIETFLSENPDYQEKFEQNINSVSLLFSYSQFLANYCIKNPDALFNRDKGALSNIKTVFDVEKLKSELKALFSSCSSIEEGMGTARIFKKNKLLIITLKDILKEAEPQEIMLDMSNLSDAILEESLLFVESFLKQRYGTMDDNPFAVISLGKLGAQELNYSSDVDIITVYSREGETSGISTAGGMTMNKVSAFEYYSKLVEEYARFLSANTEDGFVYRVDLRLRPEGQRGSLALTLRNYEEYYESWGQLWERAALLRARPAAGDMKLGNEFIEIIKPFIYRKYLDTEAIDEIRRMKMQVEQLKAGTFSRDIKRGYGGIREIEFFIHVFQLIYGGREPMLRERSTLKALHRLLQKGLIGYEDVYRLSDSYIFLRTLEHRFQQLNDLQIHTLPSDKEELNILARKMGFADRVEFLTALHNRRFMVREIYDSLFQSAADTSGKKFQESPSAGLLSSIFWDMETPVEHLLIEELSGKGIRDVHKAIHCLMKIRSNMSSFQTIRGRRLLEDIIPKFVDDALKGENPDAALIQLIDFSRILASRESYLEPITQRQELISALNFIFSHSEYLSKIIMSNPEYMESFVEAEVKSKTLNRLMKEISLLIERKGEAAAIRLFRRFEEIRLGNMFLNKKIGVVELMKSLSKAAEAVLTVIRNNYPYSSVNESIFITDSKSRAALTVIGFGKLGGRELIFNSDLDIVFLTLDEPSEDDIKNAERLLKVLMSYTKDGVAYKVDTRLRPDGSKGPLVSSIKGIADYYLKNAQPWELQALLKARPISGDIRIKRYFMEMRKEVLMKRGIETTISDIKKMRERIQKELSREAGSSGVYDIKLGTGGLEELEFIIQYLQLKNCNNKPDILVQGTLDAIRCLNKKGFLKDDDAGMMRKIYLFYRTAETILRLRNESVLKEGSDTAQNLANFMVMDAERLLKRLNENRKWISTFRDSL
jgi:glutamate-ammonia-ligase adenylyltransferase